MLIYKFGRANLLPLYFTQNSESQLSNKDLDFTKSIHVVAGVDHQINRDVRFKGEVYYQALSSIPIHAANEPSSFSMINEGGDYLIKFNYDA